MNARPNDIAGLDRSRAHPARVYDYWLGGKDNYAADREVGDNMIEVLPSIPMMARTNRRFLFQAVRHIVADLGIRQFIDIGSGMPTACNVHEVAQDLDPTARVVYVDNDLIVGAHSRALLISTPAGRAEFVTADATDPEALLADPLLTRTLDLSEPVALMLVSVLMYFPATTAHHIVATLLAALPAGSCLTISHPTADFAPEVAESALNAARAGGITYIPRTRDEVAAFFSGLDLVEPGIVPMLDWRPDSPAASHETQSARLLTTNHDSANVYYWVGMGRRPSADA